jgi:16S rRNA (cytidine1402-2'-O)-methyltransferase
LIPVPISDAPVFNFIPQYNEGIVANLKYFIAENTRTARRFLKLLNYPSVADAEIMELNEHTRNQEVPALLEPLLQGHDVGLMSDAGCPGIADPGADVVKLAHRYDIEVLPLAGPSSIVLSIMASGFSGQNFAFTGYLPIDKAARQKRIRELEQIAMRQGQAQYFIETPYRNERLFETLVSVLQPSTLIFIGRDLTAPTQLIKTRPAGEWKLTATPTLHRMPVVFGIFV